uniref:TATA box-binding protein-associated factor RNA polymerase I subunit B n=1 Tax=Caenorhabditis japonica TaxID=281687 RepID=A0A8R1HIX2_CAEJA
MAPGKTEKNDKCTACGGYDFSLNDGFMYCDRCGTLFENFEEFDDEEAGIQGIVGAGKIVIKRKKGEFDAKVKRKASEAFLRGKEKYQKAKQVEELLENRTKFFTEQVPRKEHLPYDQTPDYLYGVGRRIFAFTEILSKSAYILVNELNFNPELQKMVLAVFQRYLAHCHVAFCAQEQCGDDEELRFVAIMENINYEEEERAEKRRKMLERRGKGVKMLSKSAAAWTLLTQGNITENLDAESSEEEDQDDPEEDETIEDVNDITMGFVRKVTTALSKNSLRRAGQLVMGLEMVAAILHSAILCSGYTNILISDVVRWIREDRFRIPRRALKFLLRSLTEPGEELQSAVESREHCLRFPLFEIVRTSTMLHQSLDLSQNQAIMSFEKLAARIIENLNLPVDMLSRVLLLESIIPCDMSPLLLKQVDVKMGKNLQELTGISPKMRLKDYMASFGRKEYWAVERNLTDYDEVLLSIDTKIMAYILFAIKLTFDIDNAPCSNQNLENSPTQFDIDTWIYQLEMRVKCWQGHDMSMVLRPSCPIPEISAEVPFGEHYFCYPTRRGPGVQRLRRHAGFQKTIPAEMSFHSTSNMPTVFDIRENRYPADRKRPQAILTPLNFQSLVIRKEIDAEPAKFENIDADAEATFFKDFTVSHGGLEFSTCET